MRLVVLLTVLAAVGCSVKENRQNCPCRLMLDLTSIDTSSVKVLNIHAATADALCLQILSRRKSSQNCMSEMCRMARSESFCGVVMILKKI